MDDQRRQQREQPEQDEVSPAFRKAESEAMLEAAKTLQALVSSPAYQSAANPSWLARLFG